MLCEAADDIGKALGLPPSGLTLTIGFGPSLFRDADGADRFGSAGQRPAVLADLPSFRWGCAGGEHLRR
ncbi:Dyp-type peroxidase domain-containing protein [Phytohabitans suffuscus]|uniref:Dyp-type peroxidase domain-containing protein n=1 Tax=Phytohabitans suffuscus TaxID=624315 RepID=UPI001E348250|nr:Dyp-type peroxidase domain-containing protein [Phytohabitans suffuscus]